MRTTQRLQQGLRHLLTCALIALPGMLAAQHPVADAALQSGTVSFLGHATVGDFVGTTAHLTGTLIGGEDYSTTRGWVEAMVGTLLTGNDRRDRDLRATMNVDRYPTMRFELTCATLVTPSVDSDSTALKLRGTLTIHGVARSIELPATVLRHGDTTSVAAHFPLDLFDYDIRGLTKMFGLLRMEREIEVRVNLQFVDRPNHHDNP